MKTKLLFPLFILFSSIYGFGQNPGLAISEIFVNPSGTDSPYEWVELVATQNIDFSLTPYSIVVSNNGNATALGWVQGGSITYGFEINTGSVLAGDVVYVGGSLMAPTGTQLRVINTLTTNGDGFGNSGSGPFGNGGGNADGIAVFSQSISSITASSVPSDAVFYGTAIGGASLNATDGYQLPINDLYNGDKLLSTAYFAPEAGAGYIKATGTFNVISNTWVGTRAFTIDPAFTNDSTEITLVTTNPPGYVSVTNSIQISSEDSTSANIAVTFSNANSSEAKIIFGLSTWTNATANDDYTLTNDTLVIPANQNGTFFFPVSIVDDALAEKTERLILKIVGTINCSVVGNSYQIIYIKDNDYVAPTPSNQLNLELLTSFSNGAEGTNSSEIVAYDSLSQRLFIANSIGEKMDIVDFSNPSSPVIVSSIDISTLGGINSVAAHNGLIVAAMEGVNPQDNGKVYFFDTLGNLLNSVTVGAMPDMITFNKNYTKVLTANEGEPSIDYLNDPEGSISIIDLTPGIALLTNANVSSATFTSFNGQDSLLRAQGIRLFPQASSVAQDLEPEYITISADNTKAYVTVQEHNALAVIDIQTATVIELRPLGLSDYSSGNAMDPSDQSGSILIQSLPVKGAYMPDAIASSTINGTTYLFTANEGDARENNLVVDAARIGSMVLDSAAFPDQNILKNNQFMGRLNALQVTGDTDNDGDFDELHVLGGRSFSIWDANTGTLVFDSKDLLEQIISSDTVYSALFNASNGGSAATKNRSDDKGPEPEGVTTTTIDGNHYLFVGLERIGGAMIFNVNIPTSPVYVGYYNNRDVATNGPDRGSEGILFITKEESPTGNAILLLANEVSSTLSVYEVKTCVEVSGANAISGDLAFCEGSTTLLAIDSVAGTTIDWIYNSSSLNVADTSLTVSQAGDYAVFVQNSVKACADTSVFVSVIENSSPIISLGNDTTTCANYGPIVLTAPNGYEAYAWSNGDTTVTITVNTSGNYTLTVIDSNNCSGNNNVNVTFDPCLGLTENTKEAMIYPNPFTSFVNVKMISNDPSLVIVYGTNGAKIAQTVQNESEFSLDLTNLQSGLYFMQITQNGTPIWKVIEKK
ncbi:MAG: choice-of-anchor I family protein [Crocinitomicaceae bacterium]